MFCPTTTAPGCVGCCVGTSCVGWAPKTPPPNGCCCAGASDSGLLAGCEDAPKPAKAPPPGVVAVPPGVCMKLGAVPAPGGIEPGTAGFGLRAVSYTHLTLPTICSV